MKYIVEVNAKYLVSIEAQSALNAEHKLLDYNGIWGALAFDNKMIKTDTFLGAVQGCEMVSMDELIKMINETMDAKRAAVEAEIAHQDAANKVAELRKALEEAKEAERAAWKEAAIQSEHYNDMEERLGKQRQ